MPQIPKKLINRYLNEYKKANAIIKEKARIRSKRNRVSNDDIFNLRQKDLSGFSSNKALRKYLQTTHKIITGEYFREKSIIYKNNLINAILRRYGYDPQQLLGVTKQGITARINPARLSALKNILPIQLYATIRIIYSLNQENVEKLELNSTENLVQYQYYIGVDEENKDDMIRSLLNRSDIVEKGFFDKAFNYIVREK